MLIMCGCGKEAATTSTGDPENFSFHGGKFYYGFSPLSFSTLDTLEFVAVNSKTPSGKVYAKDKEMDYTVKGDTVSFREPFHSEDTSYEFYLDKYLVDTTKLMKGNIPEGTMFEVVCKTGSGDNGYKIAFHKDGSCKQKTSIEREGSYVRKGNEIEIRFNDDPASAYVYLIYGKKITGSYLKLWTEDVNYHKRKRMEIMAYINGIMEPLNFDRTLTLEDIEKRKEEVWAEVEEKYQVTPKEIHDIMNDVELMGEYFNRH